MVLYIGIYIESDWLYHAEWVALSNGQSGSELAEYSVALFFSLEDDEDAISSPPTELPITPSTNITINTINQGFLYSGFACFSVRRL